MTTCFSVLHVEPKCLNWLQTKKRSTERATSLLSRSHSWLVLHRARRPLLLIYQPKAHTSYMHCAEPAKGEPCTASLFRWGIWRLCRLSAELKAQSTQKTRGGIKNCLTFCRLRHLHVLFKGRNCKFMWLLTSPPILLHGAPDSLSWERNNKTVGEVEEEMPKKKKIKRRPGTPTPKRTTQMSV